MMEYINAHQQAFWFSLGFILLAIESLVLGFTSGFVLFAGLGALLTGGIMWIGILPANWPYGIASFGVSSAVGTLVLWKYLKKLQDERPPEKDLSSDLIGHEFRLDSNITHLEKGQLSYSGIDWQVEIDSGAGIDQIEAGTIVAVVSVDVGIFRVKPKIMLGL